MRLLEKATAFHGYPDASKTVWVDTGAHVCSHHIHLKPQPERVVE